MKKWILGGLTCAMLQLSAHANEEILLQRIVALEKHVAELEHLLAPVLEQERVKEIVKQQKHHAHVRMLMDAEIYERYDLQLIEKLYQTANKNWEAEDAKKSIQMLTERYPRANRTGCAVLYFGQISKKEEQLTYLQAAIAQYGNCYYGNGVQVGAYARLYLGMRYKKEGHEQKAEKLFEEIRNHYPDAIDHQGQLLTSHLDEMKIATP